LISFRETVQKPSTPDRDQIEGDLLAFVRARGHRHTQAVIDMDLLESGLLDSLMLMDLIFHLEERYGLRFDGDDVNPSNFRSISAIIDTVMDQLAARDRQPR
jgi:acyl carrier protein